MGNTVQLTKNGQPVFPVTDVSLVMGLQDAIKLPPVKVTTLPTASAETAGKMYYVGPDANDEYERYITSATNGSYEWIDLGDTSIPLPSIADNLTTDDANTALSAKQGKVLNEELGELEAKVDDLSTGKYYGYFAKEEDLPEADVDGFAYVGEGPTYTIYNLRSGVWTSSDITVNQSPIGNDEDIDQNEDGKLQFANRVYNAQQPNGMGYKILRADKTFASQVTDTNTIYEIRYGFDMGREETFAIDENNPLPDNAFGGFVYYLSTTKVTLLDGEAILLPHNTGIMTNGVRVPKRGYFRNESGADAEYYLASISTESITVKIVKYVEIPSGCALYFNGGNIKNAALYFNGTYIYGDIKMDSVRGLGKLANEYVNPVWLGAKGDGVTNDTLALRSSLDICDHIVFPDKTFLVTCAVPGSWNAPFVDYWGLVINRSNVILDCGKATFICDNIGTHTGNGFVVQLAISGNGFDKNNYTTTERISGIVVNGGTFIGSRSQFSITAYGTKYENFSTIFHTFTEGTLFNGVTILDSCGDSITQYGTLDSHIVGCTFKRARRDCINLNTRTIVDGCRFEHFVIDYTYPNGNESKRCQSAFGVSSENQSYETTTQEWINGWIVRNNYFDCTGSSRAIGISAFNVIVENNSFVLDENGLPSGSFLISGHAESVCPGYNVSIHGNDFIHKGTPTNSVYAVGCGILPYTSVCNNRFQGFNALRMNGSGVGFVFSGNTCLAKIEQRATALSWDAVSNFDGANQFVFKNNLFDGFEKVLSFNSAVNYNGARMVFIGNTVRFVNDTKQFTFAESQVTLDFYVENNHFEVTPSQIFYLTKIPADSTREFIVRGNTFKMYVKNFVVSSSDSKYYGNGAIINNVFENTRADFVKLEPNVAFTGKMAVIGNIFKGTMDGLTTQTTSDASLVVENNFAI